jgi:hypothetical protein
MESKTKEKRGEGVNSVSKKVIATVCHGQKANKEKNEQ